METMRAMRIGRARQACRIVRPACDHDERRILSLSTDPAIELERGHPCCARGGGVGWGALKKAFGRRATGAQQKEPSATQNKEPGQQTTERIVAEFLNFAKSDVWEINEVF